MKYEINVQKIKETFEKKDADSELIQNLPFIPAILIISFGMADLIPKIKDKNIFRAIVRIGKRMSKRYTKKTVNRKMRKYISLNRVIAIAEILFERIKHLRETYECRKLYHGIEFYLNIDFLEKIKMI